MARGFIGNIQKEVQKQSSENPKLSLEQPTSTPTNATTTNVPATAEQPKKKKWLMPVLIGGGVLVIGILTYVLLKKKK
jgi:hypothetical protein